MKSTDTTESNEWLWKPDSVIPTEFELLEELGRGGQGCVYKARHKTMDRVVAIKFFARDSFQSENEIPAYFQKEARAISRLDHPNIVKVLQTGMCSDGTPYLVYEYLEGMTLKALLKDKKTPGAQALSRLFTQLFAALAQAHSQGIVHRDIKPGNIMLLSETGSVTLFQVKLLDFGIAQVGNTAGRSEAGAGSGKSARPDGRLPESNDSSAKTLAGSPLYMSPEQCRGEKVDERSDYYSLACVLYECLIGKPPFAGDTALHTQYMHINEKPPLPDKRLCRELNNLLAKCLSKEPGQRPGSLSEYEEQLRAGLHMQERLSRQKSIAAAFCLLAIALSAPGLLLLLYFSVVSHNSTVLNLPGSTKPGSDSRADFPVAHLKEISANVIEKTAGSTANKLQWLKELNMLIPKLQTGRHQQALFSAYYLKADLLLLLHRPQECLDTIKPAMSFCRLRNGKTTAELAQCYNLTGKAARELNDEQLFESSALKAISIMQECKKQKKLPTIPCHEVFCLDLRTVGTDCYIGLARLAIKRRELPKAEKWALQAKEASKDAWGESSESAVITLLADIHLEQGQTDRALSEVKAMCDEARKNCDEAARESALAFELVRANSRRAAVTMQHAATWYEAHKMTKQAEEARKEEKEYMKRADNSSMSLLKH